MLRQLVVAVWLVALPAFAQTVSSVQPASQPDPKEILALEGTLLDLNAAGSCDEVGKLLLPEFKAVSLVISDREQTIEICRKLHDTCTVTHSAISQQHVDVLSEDAVGLVYKTGIVTLCGNKKANLTVNATSVWVRSDGTWKLHLHTERTIAGFAVQTQ